MQQSDVAGHPRTGCFRRSRSHQYRAKRYLQYATQDQIEERVYDIFANVTTLTPKGQIGLAPVDGKGGYWLRLWTHLLTELSIRKGGFRAGFLKGVGIPKPTWPETPKAVTALGEKTFPDVGYFFKFGKQPHMERLLREGEIRISPASSYLDPSLNRAVRDNELEFSFYTHPDDCRLQKLDRVTRQPIGEPMRAASNITYTRKTPTDYLVFCMTAHFDIRLFGDFGADACVIIKDPKAFLSKLINSVLDQMPDLAAGFDTVKYLDPFDTKPNQVVPFFSKHFRYSYQTEARVIWIPQGDALKVDHVNVRLGSLESIADILLL